MMSEQTRVVLISGAASGMGRSTARLLEDAGYTVEGCDVIAADSVAQVDVRDDDAVRRWVDGVVARHGSIDAVVTFAGRALVGAFEETAPGEAADLLDVNVLGTARVVRAALPVLRERKGGRVIVVGSGSGFVAQPFCVWYSASKAAVEKLGEGLRMEARQFGVDVATLIPGWTKTAILETAPKVAAPIAAYATARTMVEHRSAQLLNGSQAPEAVARTVLRMLSARRMRPIERVGTDVRSSFWVRRLTSAGLYERLVRRYYRVDDITSPGAAPLSGLRMLPDRTVMILDEKLRMYGDGAAQPYTGRELANDKVRFAYRIYSRAYPLVATLVFWLVWSGRLGVLARFYANQITAAARTGDTFVEVGVGDGSLTQFAFRSAKVKRTPPLLFVDLSPDMLTKAAKRFRKTPDAMFLVSDVNTLAIPRGSVRWLGCYGALHVFTDPQRALDHLAELLRDDGELSLSILVSPEVPWKDKLIDKFAATNLITSNFTRADVEELIGKSGLQIVENIRNGHQLLIRARRADAAISAVQA
jgi:NAD(P)-dependent dehydrogenase (short-subunit alcohol dehydrogenase family)/SAM-dependent methyltransferase